MLYAFCGPSGSSLAVFLCLPVSGFIRGVCFVTVCTPSPSFGVSERLCFMIVTFPGYLHFFNALQVSLDFPLTASYQNMILLLHCTPIYSKYQSSNACHVFAGSLDRLILGD